jgi:hypothetical protein
MDVLANDLMVAGITNDVDTAEESDRREYGMRAVEQGDLTLVVRLLTGYEQHMKARLVGRELTGDLSWCLDYPQVEVLSLYDEVVAIAYLLLYLGNLLAWEARHDAVYERSIYATRLVEPLLEVSRQLPQFNVLIDAFL